MTVRAFSLLLAAFSFVLACWLALPPVPNPIHKPIHAWMLGKAPNDRIVADEAGDWSATIQGSPAVSAKPTAMQFRGGADALLVASKQARIRGKELTLAAWVRIDAGARKGGIIGQIQDNRYAGKGLSLGYDSLGFRFGLAAQSTGQADGTMTWLRSSVGLNTGKWTHVAATYDGTTMRLFVDGILEGTSQAQSGPIIPADAPLTIGGYVDSDEWVPFVGAIHSAELFDKALPGDAIMSLVESGQFLKSIEGGPTAAWFVVAPYLQYPTTHSISIAWETSVPVVGRVEYGLTTPLGNQVATPAGTMHVATINDLKPGTPYYYRVVCDDPAGGEVASTVLSFQTDAGPGSPFVFATIGDTQKNPRVTGQVATRALENRPAFILHLGDVVDNGSDKTEWVNELFRPCQELFGRVPVIPCIGNHERNHKYYYQYFVLPEPEYYYSFRYGDAEFFCIDSNKVLLPISEQYRWLDKALAASTAKWKFCFHHHPAYSSDSDDYGNTFSGKISAYGGMNPRQLLPLVEKYNVDMVLNGHVHLYERTHPIRGGKVDHKSGVVHLTTGGGGGKLENFVPHSSWIKAAGRVDYHMCLVQVDSQSVHLKAYDKDGILFDTWSKTK